MTDRTTHFGYKQVREDQKATLVRGVFDSVADRYDLMNDLMSLGAHRWWKSFAVNLSGIHRGNRVLDVAGGTGDLSALFVGKVGAEGSVTLVDVNAAMLRRGRDRLTDRGVVGNVNYVQCDAQSLPFEPNYFHGICIGFGLRNVTNQQQALESMFGCLRPGGRLLVLEFSRPSSKLVKSLYDAYSFGVLPRLGKLVAEDAASYQYLVESIRKQPPQEELMRMMEQAGFERVGFNNLAGGVVAVHTGFKL